MYQISPLYCLKFFIKNLEKSRILDFEKLYIGWVAKNAQETSIVGVYVVQQTAKMIHLCLKHELIPPRSKISLVTKNFVRCSTNFGT